MKKEIIICIIVIIGVITLNTISSKYTRDSVESIKNDLGVVKEKIENKREKEEIIQGVLSARKNWDNKYNRLAYYIEHDELEKVELYLVGLDSNINSEEYSQAMEELDKCIYILEHIENKYSFNLKNIF